MKHIIRHMDIKKPKLIIILGPTASGKTKLAVSLAQRIQGEIISVDSRQVYRKMDIGSGKDLNEYQNIPYHLIDIIDPSDEFSVSKFQNLATQSIQKIIGRNHTPILCGGTGHYIKALIEDYPFDYPGTDLAKTRKVEHMEREVLYQKLKEAGLWEERDWQQDSKRRMVRALEKNEEIISTSQMVSLFSNQFDYRLYYIQTDRQVVREKIWDRLQQRFEQGMIEEVQSLLEEGISTDRLMRFGLEYKWITRYLEKEVSYDEMNQKLYTDICRFAKRQMTFIRYLQKNGHQITAITDRGNFLAETTEWLKEGE